MPHRPTEPGGNLQHEPLALGRIGVGAMSRLRGSFRPLGVDASPFRAPRADRQMRPTGAACLVRTNRYHLSTESQTAGGT